MQVEFRNAWAPAWAAPSSAASTAAAGTFGASSALTRPEMLQQARRSAERLTGAALDLLTATKGIGASTPRLPVAWSDRYLGLNTVPTVASVRSSAEVNTVATSYGPIEPTWDGGSTADPIVSGTYTGAYSGDLTFEVTQVGLLGLTPSSIKVTDSSGGEVALLTIPSGQNGVVRAIGNGLAVRFSSGTFSFGDTFTVGVSATVGSSLRPDNPLDGLDGEDPGLDATEAVQSGSFKVNGVTISVGSGDSVAQVLARITASAADVEAVYDSATDQVVLTSKLVGSAGSVVLSDDTSGLLSALKLDDVAPVQGEDADADRPLSEVARFSSVTAGSLVVNGVAVAFDPAVDSLQVLVDRVTSGTDVDATLTNDDQIAQFAGRVRGEAMQLSDGGSGLLDALGISRRAVSENDGTTALSASRRRALAEELVAVRSELSALWNLGGSSALPYLRQTMVDAFAGLGGRDAGVLQQLLGVKVVNGELQFEARTVEQVGAALGGLTRSELNRLRSGAGNGSDRGVAGALAVLGRTLARRAID